MRPDDDATPLADQAAALERAFIAEFLEQRGLTMHTIQALPEADRHRILRDASLHASMRLSEVESRWRYVDDLHQK